MKIFNRIYPIIIVICLSFFAIQPLFTPGFFPMHDDTQVARVYEMGKALHDGVFPVRYIADLGYGNGYPLFNFYAPLAYYVGGIATFYTDALTATKFMFIVGIMLAGISMYLLAKEFWGKIGGIVCSTLYMYASYHAVEIYVRGDVAEFFAYAFIPLVFYALWKTHLSKDFYFALLGVFAYAGIILSHNLTAMMVSPFLGVFILLLFLMKKKKQNILLPLLIIIGGIGLSAWYWFPTLLEMSYTNVLSQIGGGADYKDHYVCLQQLWTSEWGFGGSTKGCIDGMSFRVGKIPAIFSIISVAVGFFVLRKEKKKFVFFTFSVISLIFSIFLMLEASRPLWDTIPMVAFFQYPWRFLIMTSFLSSFIIGVLFWYISLRYKKALLLAFFCFLGAILFFQIKLFVPQTILSRSANDYTNITTLSWVASKISDEYMPKDFRKPTKETEIVREKIAIETPYGHVLKKSEKTHEMQYALLLKNPSRVLVRLAYFPAWHAYLNGKRISYIVSNNGIFIDLPGGESTLLLRFEQTPIEKIANSISLTSIGLLVLGIIWRRKLFA